MTALPKRLLGAAIPIADVGAADGSRRSRRQLSSPARTMQKGVSFNMAAVNAQIEAAIAANRHSE
jgi:hypothetical protein